MLASRLPVRRHHGETVGATHAAPSGVRTSSTITVSVAGNVQASLDGATSPAGLPIFTGDRDGVPEAFWISMHSSKTILVSDVDHRNFSIPLFLLGAAFLLAGAIGTVVGATTDLQVLNPGGAMGFGVVLLFGSIAVTFLLNPEAEGTSPVGRTLPIVGAVALVLLVAAAGGAFAVGASGSPPGASNVADTVGGTEGLPTAGFLLTEDFTSSLQGVMTATPLGGLGDTGTTTRSHELSIPESATNARFELMWEPASPGGATELEIRFEADDGTILASASGGPGLVLDVDVQEGSRIVVSLPDGAASTAQEYHAYASYFNGDVPTSFSAIK